MQKLSTDELFHFTKLQNLLGILKDGFQPRYSLEHTFLSNLFDSPSIFGPVPMVCFCDIPLEMVSEHIDKYGKYAIGLDKKWGEKYGLNPVLYIDKNSRIGDAISAMANAISLDVKYHPETDPRFYEVRSTCAKGIRELFNYSKQYERKDDEPNTYRNEPIILKKGRFYDEREWRFVPFLKAEETLTLSDKNDINEANKRLMVHSLYFEIDDIKYIVFDKLEDKNKIIEAISKKFNISETSVTTKIKFRQVDSLSPASSH